MELAAVLKLENSFAVHIPAQYFTELGISDNDKVKISKQGNVITIEKPRESKSLRQLVEERSGVDFDTYLQNNPYNHDTDSIEFGRVGSEKI